MSKADGERGEVGADERVGEGDLDRRGWLRIAGGSAVAACSALLTSCGRDRAASTKAAPSAPAAATGPAPVAAAPAVADPTLVRVLSVPTSVEGKVLPALIKAFEAEAPYRVELTASPQLYELARQGHGDLLVSHYGHRDAEAFVLDGLGEWPRTIFSNQMALVGPPRDPAGVRGLDDVGEALHRIAATKSKFVVNALDGVRYLSEILWNAAGQPARRDWWIESTDAKDGAIKKASELGAYTLWGLTPFLRLGGATPLALEPLVLADPLLQRMMVSIVAKPKSGHAVNVAGATTLQTFFLQAKTQARIRTIHYPGTSAVTWVPAGRHNRTEMLPKG
jgi:tungstate transport system substrate-binding protein